MARQGRAAHERGRPAAEGEGALLIELLEYLARRLVDEPDAVRVEGIDDDDAYVLRLYVAPEDRGKVIGRQGRVARSLRTIVRAAGGREHRRVVLEIVE